MRKKAIDEKHWLLIINTGKEVKADKIKECACEGFPSRFRPSIWVYLAKSAKKSKITLSKLLEGVPDQKAVIQINKDVLRTSPIGVFRSTLKESLTRVLLGYSLYDPEISYTQGMNFVVAIILLTLTNYGVKVSPFHDGKSDMRDIEEKSFVILRYLMEEKGVRKMMFINADLIADISLRLDDLIAELSPEMSHLIVDSGFSSQMFFSSPVLSCLTNVTNNIHLLQRFMDMLIAYDYLVCYRIIAHFVASASFLTPKINADNIFDILRDKIYDEVYQQVGDEGVTRILSSI